MSYFKIVVHFDSYPTNHTFLVGAPNPEGAITKLRDKENRYFTVKSLEPVTKYEAIYARE